MAFGKNTTPQQGGGGATPESSPKKADVILKANHEIAVKQEELIRQTKLSNSRIDAAIELLQKSIQATNALAKHTDETFAKLEKENAALKQELLYLAKQSENIYAGLAEKISTLSEQARNRENAYVGLADKVNDLAVQSKNEQAAYTEIVDRLTELSEQTKRSEGDYSELLIRLNEVANRTKNAEETYELLCDKIDGFGEQTKRNEVAYAELSDKVTAIADQTVHIENTYADLAFKIADISEQTKRADDAYTELSEKLADVSEHTRRSENVYLELTDKIDVLAERVERLNEENIRATSLASAASASPAVAPVMPAYVKEEVDYDKLAQKVADLVSVREFISPDLIASKVAEQVVIPEVSEAKVAVNEEKIAEEVVSRINLHLNDDGKEVAVNLNVDLDEDKIARNVLAGINYGITDDKAVAAPVDIDLDEEKIAKIVSENLNVDLNEEKIAQQVADILTEKGLPVVTEIAPAAVSAVPLNIDEEELADRIALKVGSLKAEDFEILVDDEGCDSISKEIADKLDYAAISEAVAEKLRYALDLADANEPDYEEMAARISEKITVAGINEDAIADKAAAVLSNYLPDFDTDEIADKVQNAVIDVLNAQLSSMTMPALDNEELCNTISDRIIESQAEHDYDIVIDEDGISKITELVSEEIENQTAERFTKISEAVDEVKELLSQEGREVVVSEYTDGNADERFAQVENSIAEIKELLTREPEEVTDAETDERFEQVENSIAEIKEILANDENAENDATAERFNSIENSIEELKKLIASGVIAATATEVAASAAAYEAEEEEPLVTVSDLVPEEVEEPAEPEEEKAARDDYDYDDDDELMPGNEQDGTDFSNMMKYNRSFIARIIQSTDDQKQYYGAVKHALLSYKKVNSNIAWGAERFNKGRETIARFKIRGKTLCLYLALDPNEYKTSVYHHLDATDNKSMAGTPMMVKIKSALGVKKAIRLIDEMLESRGAEKRFVPERDYAAMYPYETIEELIEDGIVKDVRKNKK